MVDDNIVHNNVPLQSTCCAGIVDTLALGTAQLPSAVSLEEPLLKPHFPPQADLFALPTLKAFLLPFIHPQIQTCYHLHSQQNAWHRTPRDKYPPIALTPDTAFQLTIITRWSTHKNHSSYFMYISYDVKKLVIPDLEFKTLNYVTQNIYTALKFFKVYSLLLLLFLKS